jgi:hypothetical protein
MYSAQEKHAKLAENSNAYWFYQKPECTKKHPNIFEYKDDPSRRIIMLAQPPETWFNAKRGRVGMSTFFNHLDWKEASKYGLSPVLTPPERRCDQPSKFVSTTYDGQYQFCCFDFARELDKVLGDVSTGVEGFYKFWFGEFMQHTRWLLYNKLRRVHSQCSRCEFTSIRCDIPRWSEDILNYYWDGGSWKTIQNKG